MNVMFVVFFVLAWVAASVFVYSLQRKVELNNRYWASMRKAINEWDRDAALDAKAAVDAELWWTVVLVVALCFAAVFIVGAIDAL